MCKRDTRCDTCRSDDARGANTLRGAASRSTALGGRVRQLQTSFNEARVHNPPQNIWRLATLLGAAAFAACVADSPTSNARVVDATALLQTWPPTVSTMIEAATFGPDGQIIIPANCTKTNFMKDSTRARTFSDLNNNGQADDSIWVRWDEGYSPGQCGLNYDPGGGLYDGGVVWSGVYQVGLGIAGQNTMPATMNNDRELAFRAPGQLYLEAMEYEEYTFHYWEITPQSGPMIHDPSIIIYVPASQVGQRYVGIFQKNPDP